jgi:hypothetical protein
MAPHLTPRAAIVTRSSISGGAIAGAVIGSIIGILLVSVVVGFLYFRWKRRSHSVAAEEDKPVDTERRLSLPAPDQNVGQPQFDHDPYVQPWTGDAQIDHQGPAWNHSTGFAQQSPPGNDFTPMDITHNLPDNQQAHFLNHSTFTSDPLNIETIGVENEYVPAPTAMEGGAADYYDTNIAMDSDPEQAPTGPTRQMTELYEAQLRKSRESRKNSKGSAWSRLTKGFMSKRKRSTRVSEIAMEEGQAQASPSSTSHPDVAMPSIEATGSMPAEQSRGFGHDAELFEEPQEMSDSSRADAHTHKRAKRRGPSGDTSGEVPHRLNSLQRDPTSDSQLPSAALRQKPMAADKSVARQATRFQSPDLPEPMELDDKDIIGRDGTPVVRGSHSPPQDTTGFRAVNPMDIMRPSNAAEKAVFTNAELIRIASVSISPPTSPPYDAPTPPARHPQNGTVEHGLDDADQADESDYDDVDEEEDVEGEGNALDGNQWVGNPPHITIGDASVTDGGPSDWSTPAGTTMTNTSAGRTPGTDITSSPSPVPSPGDVHLDTSISPPDSAGSPRPLLSCDQCTRTFDQIHKLNHHKRYHDRRHCCPYPGCDKKFGTKTHLDRHINDKHEKTKGYHCTEEGCQYYTGGKIFPRKDNWKRHMLNKHGITPTVEPQPIE